MLQPGARHHRGVAMLPREPGKARDGAVEIGQQRIDGGAQGQHGGGIDHVLAGGAPMHIARGLGVGLGDIGGERLDQRDREIAGPRRGLAPARQDRTTSALQAAAIGAAALSGMTPVSRFGARQRCFEIEHVLQARHIVADGAHGGARQHRREQGREGGAHDARDLTIPAGLCQSPKRSQVGKSVALRICIAPRPPVPFLLGVRALLGEQDLGRCERREAPPWP